MTPSPAIEGIWGPGNNLELWALKSSVHLARLGK